MLIAGLVGIIGNNARIWVRLDPDALRVGATLIGRKPALINVVDGKIDLGTLSLDL